MRNNRAGARAAQDHIPTPHPMGAPSPDLCVGSNKLGPDHKSLPLIWLATLGRQRHPRVSGATMGMHHEPSFVSMGTDVGFQNKGDGPTRYTTCPYTM